MTERFLKLNEVCDRIGMRVTTVKEMEKAGKFIEPIKINGTSHPRYLESELNAWMEMQIRMNREVA